MRAARGGTDRPHDPRRRCRSNSIVALSVTFTKPATLGAVMLNSLQGKVIAPTASIPELDSRDNSPGQDQRATAVT